MQSKFVTDVDYCIFQELYVEIKLRKAKPVFIENKQTIHFMTAFNFERRV